MRRAATTLPDRAAAPSLGTRVLGRVPARVATWFARLLVAAAVLAPLIANEFPLFLIDDGAWSFPFVAGMDGADVAWLLGGVAFIVLRVLRRRAFGDRPRAFALVSTAVAVGIGALAWTTQPANLAVVDYDALAEKSGNVCLWAPVPHGWLDQETRRPARFVKPFHYSDHPLGTDAQGRDVLARLVYGARVSLLVGVLAVGAAVVIGVLLGAIAGYAGGALDALLSWLIQVVLCFPVLFAVLILQIFLPPSILWIVVLLAFIRWTGAARLMRAEVRRLRGEDWVLAARVQGIGPMRILTRHLVPNALGPVLVNATFGIAAAILLEASLSFLGLGVVPPEPSWGEMLRQGREAMARAPHLVWVPGCALFLTVLSVNALGEALRAALDPRDEGRP